MIKCDLCSKPAVVHEVTVKGGVKKEIHLCKDHAEDAGIAMPVPQPINQLLTQFVIAPSSARKKAKAVKKACGSCGLSFARFRQKGVVGCPACYEMFERHLGPLIERAQNGAANHTGKAPRRAGATIDRQLQIRQLIRDLDDAVAAEQYERAATLRDRLTSLKGEAAQSCERKPSEL
jgi:protein arginine kinase activator